MSEFKQHLKTVERLLRTAQICGEHTTGKNLYDFLGIDKTATEAEIKASIEENYDFYLAKRYVSGWKTLSNEFMVSRPVIEQLLREYRNEYDSYLLALGVKELRNYFISLTQTDQKFGAEEEKQLIKEGQQMGWSEKHVRKMIAQWRETYDVKTLETPTTPSPSPHDGLHVKTYYELFGIANDASYSEIVRAYEKEYNLYVHEKNKARWDRVSEGWEILKDSEKRAAYDKALNEPEQAVEDGIPLLKVICKMDSHYLYKDVKKGAQFTETIIIKNDHKGQLQGKIISDAEWLVPERADLDYNSEQILGISILTAKIPEGIYNAKGTITLDTNGGPPYLMSFRVILKDLEAAAAGFRSTYVPLAAACAGFIGSFSHSPFLWAPVSAVLAGILFYFIAKIIVKAALESGLNIFKLPSRLIHSAAAGILVLTILFHSFGSSAIKQDIEQAKLNIFSLSEKLYDSVTPQAEQPLALAEAQKNRFKIGHSQQFSLAGNTSIKDSIALSNSFTFTDTKAAKEFDWRAADDKVRYGFGCSDHNELAFRCVKQAAITMQQNPLALYFPSQDWDYTPKSSKDSGCNGSLCPPADVDESNKNGKNQPRLASALKSPDVRGGYVTAARINARLAASTASSSKWKPKTRSFAPPSRDDL